MLYCYALEFFLCFIKANYSCLWCWVWSCVSESCIWLGIFSWPVFCSHLRKLLCYFGFLIISFSLPLIICLFPFQSCSRILLVEEERLDFLKKMRNPKLDHLKKNETFKRVVKRCNAMLGGTKMAVTCSRCGYINGPLLNLFLYYYFMFLINMN